MDAKKAAATSIIATGGTTAAGYLISQAVTQNEIKEETGSPVESSTKTTTKKIGKILEEAKFEKLTFESKKHKETTSIQEIIGKFKDIEGRGQTGKRDSLKTKCSTLFEKDYTETEYKEAVQKCVLIKSFKERATALELSPKDTTSTSGTWSSDNYTTEISKSKFSSQYTETSKHKSYCQKAEALKTIDFNTEAEITKEWGVYEKLCLKDATKHKDFWLGDSTTTGK